jgi:hypothetical protein
MYGDRLSDEAMAAFAPDIKVGLIATVDPEGLPHVTLITSLTAKDERRLMWGQFTEGRSKTYVREHPEVGFLVLTLDRRIWRGTARWRDAASEGEDLQAFNSRPMFRYNAYFRVHTVHRLDLVSISERMSVPLARMVWGFVMAKLARVGSGSHRAVVLNPWTLRHLGALTTLKFLSWVDDEGFPRIVPCVACVPAGTDRLVVAPTLCKEELAGLPAGQSIAIFGLNPRTESVLVRGSLTGFGGVGPAQVGLVDLSWVYNSMPPVPGQIYPPVALKPFTD